MAKLPRPNGFEDPKHLPSKTILAEIGRLAIVSASIDDILHAIYWKFARLTDAVGAVITGDIRPGRLVDDIIKVAKAAKVDPKIVDDLKDIFADHKNLAILRNQCIHWTWNRPTGRKIVVEPPTHKTGHTPITLTLTQIKKLADDLVWIETRLDAHAMTDEELAQRKKEEKEPDIYVPTPWLDKQ